MSGWGARTAPESAEIGQAGWPVSACVPSVSPPPPPPAKLPSPRLKLETVANVRRELARIYREARRGELKVDHATRLAYLLDLMARMIERSELEARIAALETARDRRP